MSLCQVLDFIHALADELVDMDVMEVNPRLDQNTQTAVLAGWLLHEGRDKAWTQRKDAS
ncbi:MAG: hypothetical protein D6704_13735 [Nitrospirae bacterium]|nr:MAG: hypothetical protein D6704_13735 [Nitrospirota bacterium]